VADLQVYYPATSSTQFSSGQPTTTTLTASTTTPAVNNKVTFTATLTSGTTLLSGESVRIYHYIGSGSTPYTDVIKTTGPDGKITFDQTFSSVGQRPYYATFAADGTFVSTTSSVVNININVGITQVELKASPLAPAVNQQVTFTATLTSGGTPLSNKPVTIYHYLNNVRYTDTTANTNAAGQIKLTQTFGSTGQRPYYATFAGDSSYKAATSSAVNINVS
jgi:glucose/arabinose dehydrogenase